MNSDLKPKFYLLIFLLFFAGIMEIFGLAMIIPVVKIIIDPNEITNFIQEYNFPDVVKNLKIFQLTILILGVTFSIYLIKNLYLLAVSWYQVTFLKNFTNDLTSKVFDNILKKKYLYFTNENSTNFIKIIANDSVVLRHNLNYCAQIITELFSIALISSLLFYTHPVAMLSTVILFLIGSLIFLAVLKSKTKIWANERNIFERKRLSGIKQIINSIRDLKLLNAEKKFTDQFRRDNDFYLNVNRKSELMLSVPRIWIEMLTIITVLSLLFILIFLDNYKVLPKSIIPVLGLYIGASFKLIPSFNRIVVGVQAIRFVAPVLEEFKKLSSSEDIDREIYQANEVIEFKNNIQLKNINFSYEKNKKVITNLDLEIKKGDKIGILGESGSGKSTLLDIMTGMIDDYSGEVLVDGKNINRGIKSWRKLLSYLSQNSVFLNDTIKNNILLGSTKVDDKLIKDSMEKSHILNLVNGMPLRENTHIGENAIKLSGGEKQRIALARIFYLNRDILILDESTNALDEDTEKKILNNIISKFSDKTIIQVSHNPAVLSYCNKIFRFVKGELILD